LVANRAQELLLKEKILARDAGGGKIHKKNAVFIRINSNITFKNGNI
jgi:hypothetical protein